jgi:hypothetical protein
MTSLITASLFQGSSASLGTVEGLAIDGDGNVYISCGNSRNLVKIFSDGSPSQTYTFPYRMRGICIVGDRLFVTDLFSSRLHAFDSNTINPNFPIATAVLNVSRPQSLTTNYDGVSAFYRIFVSADLTNNAIAYLEYNRTADAFVINSFFSTPQHPGHLAFRRSGSNQYLYAILRTTGAMTQFNVTNLPSTPTTTNIMFSDTTNAWGITIHPTENIFYVGNFTSTGAVYAYGFNVNSDGSFASFTSSTLIVPQSSVTTLAIGSSSTASSVSALPLVCDVTDTFHLYVGTTDTYVADFYVPLICVGEGTRIRCQHGDRLVEDLAEGDEIMTLTGIKKIVAIRKTTMRGYHLGPKSNLPFRIPRGSFEDGPSSDLLISGSHAVWLGDSFRHVSCMRRFEVETDLIDKEFSLYHLCVDEYPSVMFANDLPVETCAEYARSNGKKISVECRDDKCELYSR